MTELVGFDRVGVGVYRGRGLAYVLFRQVELAPSGELYLWNVWSPEGDPVALRVAGLDEANRRATEHASLRPA